MRNTIREDIDKNSTSHTIEQTVQLLTGVALNTHTRKGLGGGGCLPMEETVRLSLMELMTEIKGSDRLTKHLNT